MPEAVIENRGVGMNQSRAICTTFSFGEGGVRCDGCGGWVQPSLNSRRKGQRLVLANVYRDGRWSRLERWHEACYCKAGQPYGAAPFRQPLFVGDGRRPALRRSG